MRGSLNYSTAYFLAFLVLISIILGFTNFIRESVSLLLVVLFLTVAMARPGTSLSFSISELFLLWLTLLLVAVAILNLSEQLVAPILSIILAFLLRNDAQFHQALTGILGWGTTLVIALYGIIGLLSAKESVGGSVYENLINGVSSNGVTMFCTSMLTALVLIKNDIKKLIIFPLAVINILISFLAYGRAGIICSIGLFGLLIFRYVKAWYAIVWLLALSVGIFIISPEYLIDLIDKTKLGSGLFDSHRYIVYASYFEELSWVSAVKGSDYPSYVYEFLNGNPHSSFIRAHHLFGIPALLLFAYILLIGGVRLGRYGFFLILLLMLRGGVEAFLFVHAFDFLLFFTILRSGRRCASTRLKYHPAPVRFAGDARSL